MQSHNFDPVAYAKSYYSEHKKHCGLSFPYPEGVCGLDKAVKEYEQAKNKVDDLMKELDSTNGEYTQLCVETEVTPFEHSVGNRTPSSAPMKVKDRNTKRRRITSLKEDIRTAIRERIRKEMHLVAVVAQVNLAHHMEESGDQDADKYIDEKVLETYSSEDEEDAQEEKKGGEGGEGK